MNRRNKNYICIFKVSNLTGYTLFSGVSELFYMTYGFNASKVSTACIIKMRNRQEEYKILNTLVNKLIDDEDYQFILKEEVNH